ncbi:MAG: hypothetical protein IKX47_06020, partial [Oscillospiraceae bacterium]|nr:hypothetical protein [Oscillospiraceae bacterium]
MVKTHPPFWHTLICQSDCVAACEALRFSATELRLRRFFVCIVFLERDDPMKSSGKRALAFILCLILCIGLLQAGALAATPLTVTGITASKTTACVGETITWTATATGGSGTLQYYFIIYKDGSKVTTRVYNTANTFSYIPMEPGTYKARVYVKDATDTKVNKLSTGVTVSEAAGPSITSITANKTTASVG